MTQMDANELKYLAFVMTAYSHLPQEIIVHVISSALLHVLHLMAQLLITEDHSPSIKKRKFRHKRETEPTVVSANEDHAMIEHDMMQIERLHSSHLLIQLVQSYHQVNSHQSVLLNLKNVLTTRL